LLIRPRRRAHSGVVAGDLAKIAGLAFFIGAGFFGGFNQALAGLVPAELSEMNEGVASYESGEYADALVSFEAALVQAPDHPKIGLAVGETLFQLERYEEAVREFERVLQLTDDPQVRAETLFNLGTARLAAGDPGPAVTDLRDSLIENPDQKDALFNLEVALQRLKQQEKEQQEQEQEEKQDEKQDEKQEEKQDEENKDDQEEQQNEEDQQDQEQENQENQEQDEQQSEDNKEEQEPEQQPEDGDEAESEQSKDDSQEPESDAELDPEQLTKEQQEQILQALDRDEEELKRSVQKRLKGGKPKSGKKW